MGALALDLANVLDPSPEEILASGEAARALARAREPHIRLVAEGSEPIEIPATIFKALIRVLAEIGSGNAVAVVPIQAELTTQQAADLLNISRPHLVKLLEKGELRYHMTGTHRRVRAQDLLDYKGRLEQLRSAALADIAAIDQEFGLYDDEKVGAAD